MIKQLKAALISSSYQNPEHVAINGSDMTYYFRDCEIADIKSGMLVVTGVDFDSDFTHMSWNFPFHTDLETDLDIFKSFNKVDLEKLLGEAAYLDFTACLEDFFREDGDYLICVEDKEFTGNELYYTEDELAGLN